MKKLGDIIYLFFQQEFMTQSQKTLNLDKVKNNGSKFFWYS